MHTLKLIIFILIISLVACQEREKKAIIFCESLDSLNNCLGESDHFPKEKRVYVRYEPQQPLKNNNITGGLFVILDGEKTYLASQNFTFNPAEGYVSYYLPFDRFKRAGDYQVEFMDIQGYVLDSARVYLE